MVVRVAREWAIAGLEFVGGILRRFYLWVAPLVILQPIDLLDKLGIDVVIPDEVVYALVGLGLFVSAIDVYKEARDRAGRLTASADAREVAGSLFMEPVVFADV